MGLAAKHEGRKDGQVARTAEPSSRLWLSVGLSGAAVALAVLHVAFPDIEIDAVTVALLAIATVPWLAPLLKTIELPGGWKFELRQFRQRVEDELQENVRQVRDIAERVEEIAQFTIGGSVSPLLRDQLMSEMSLFRGYL
ncbi:MAG: hypothetical protein WBM50_05310, partial [Acidimicrobiales bacterium]